MIKKYNLSDYPINFNSDFAIYGNGETAEKFQYDQKKIKIFAINQAVRFALHQAGVIDVVTMYPHEDYNYQYLKQHYPDRDFNLIIIQLSDIRKNQLPSGDTANMLVHYLVHQMKKRGVRERKIYLTGFDFTYEKNWKPQIDSLNYCQIMAEYESTQIICTSKNQRLNFLKQEGPRNKFLLPVKKKSF